MSKSSCPLLDALRGRGPAAYTGEPLSFLLIEVQSNRLWIRGATPLQDNGERYVAAGTEYCYVLEAHEAEKLLRALTRHSRDRPERILADNFEFSRPGCPLWAYLDCLHISYHYEESKGEPL